MLILSMALQVEKKLSQMILDKKLNGSLNQDDGMLIVYERQQPDAAFEAALATIHAMGEVTGVFNSEGSFYLLPLNGIHP